MRDTLELIARPGDAEGIAMRLAAPRNGWFTRARGAGQVLVPGADAGVLRVLDHHYALVVPPGVYGTIRSAPPDRVLEPVGYGSVLYDLAALEGGESLDVGAAQTEAAGPVLGAPYPGRFWTRPAPGEDAFVAAGDVVEEGRAVGLIEVMKTFTQVVYRAEGGLPSRARVVRFLADDGAELRAGDPLLEVEPA